MLSNCDRLAGFYLGFFVWGEVDTGRNLELRDGKKKFFRPSRGSGGMLPCKILKI